MPAVYKALYKFDATDPTDLALKPGDLIDVAKVDPGEWGMGISRTTGNKGAFPWTYVQEVQGAAAPEAAAPPPSISRASKPGSINTGGGGGGAAGPKSPYQNVVVGGFGTPGDDGAAPPPLVARASTSGSGGAASAAAAAASPRVMINPGYAADPSLEGKDWFAGAMSRDAAKVAIMGHPDGTFLIRTSTRHDGYSLSVKFADQCRHVKVLKDGSGKYGFTAPCEYASITAFVENFQAVSLSVYNAELETKLAYPYKTAPAGDGPAQDTENDIDEDMYATKREALRGKMAAESASHYTKKSSTYDTAYYSTEVNAIAKKKKAMDAVMVMFQDQIDILKRAQTSVTEDAEKAAIAANMGTILQKKVDAERELQAIIAQLEAARKSEDTSQRGGSVSTGGNQQKPATPLAQIKPVPDSATSDFYIGVATREDAEEKLKGMGSGTYLVRKSTRPKDPYTLSLRVGAKIKHIQIKYDGVRFGLADPLAFYSLEGLCEYYSTHLISPQINIMLSKAYSFTGV